MLREISHPCQHPGEPFRRWFTSPTADLYLWYDAAQSPIGFRFSYDKGDSEKAVTWKSPHLLSHMMVDDGESGPMSFDAAPMLSRPVEGFDREQIAARFREDAGNLPPPLVEFVLSRLTDGPRSESGSPV